MDDFLDSSSDGSGSDTAGLFASLATAASNAYSTTVLANANPLNTALITGGTAATTAGTTSSIGASVSSSAAWIIGGVLLLVIGLFAFGRRG